MDRIKGLKIGGMKPPELPKVAGVISPKATNSGMPSKVGSQAVVKTPKAKMMAQATDRPSKFFKSEDFLGIKKSSIENLRVFLERHRRKSGA